MLKSSFCGRLFGRSPSGRAFRCKSSLCCGLSPAIPNVGEKGFHCLALKPWRTGCPVPASVSDHFGRLNGRSRTSGRKDKRNTSVRAVTRGFGCSPKPPVPRPARKSSPAFVRQPEADRALIYFSRPYLLALGNGRSRLSGRLLFPAPGK